MKYLRLIAASIAFTTAFAAEPKTERIGLSYIEATDAYKALTSAVTEASKVVISIEPATNSLLIVSESPASASVRQLLRQIDVPPTPITLEASVTATKPGEKPVVLLRPTIVVNEGKPADIVFRAKDGTEFSVKVTPTTKPKVAAR